MASDKLAEEIESFQNGLISRATGGSVDHALYAMVRQRILANKALEPLVPRWVRTCRDPDQFWGHISAQFSTYKERKQYIWNELQPLIEAAEQASATPAHASTADTLTRFDSDSVHAVWLKAMERRIADPEGAITAARTLLESVCKHILEDANQAYEESADLPALYKMAADELNLSPSQHTQQIFKQILGGCSAVVGGLGALRNKLSDAHGTGRKPARPASRHAELAVNLAGAVATFLIQTLEARAGSEG